MQISEFLAGVQEIFRLRKTGNTYDANEFLRIANSADSNPLGLNPERAISNLVYTFYRRNRIQDTIYGYYRSILVGDYASTSKKTKKPELKSPAEGQRSLLGDE